MPDHFPLSVLFPKYIRRPNRNFSALPFLIRILPLLIILGKGEILSQCEMSPSSDVGHLSRHDGHKLHIRIQG